MGARSPRMAFREYKERVWLPTLLVQLQREVHCMEGTPTGLALRGPWLSGQVQAAQSPASFQGSCVHLSLHSPESPGRPLSLE